MMRKTIAIFLVLAFLCGAALAQQKVSTKTAKAPTSSAVYHVTDMIDKENNRMEVWTRQILSVNEEGSPHSYKTIKKAFDGSFTDTDISTRWSTESRSSQESLYMRERFTMHPKYMDPGESSFGYVEQREADDTVVKSWPMFYRVDGAGSMRRAVFQIFLSDGDVWQITRDYMDGEYHFPMRESNVIRIKGKIVSHDIYARQK